MTKNCFSKLNIVFKEFRLIAPIILTLFFLVACASGDNAQAPAPTPVLVPFPLPGPTDLPQAKEKNPLISQPDCDVNLTASVNSTRNRSGMSERYKISLHLKDSSYVLSIEGESCYDPYENCGSSEHYFESSWAFQSGILLSPNRNKILGYIELDSVGAAIEATFYIIDKDLNALGIPTTVVLSAPNCNY